MFRVACEEFPCGIEFADRSAAPARCHRAARSPGAARSGATWDPTPHPRPARRPGGPARPGMILAFGLHGTPLGRHQESAPRKISVRRFSIRTSVLPSIVFGPRFLRHVFGFKSPRLAFECLLRRTLLVRTLPVRKNRQSTATDANTAGLDVSPALVGVLRTPGSGISYADQQWSEVQCGSGSNTAELEATSLAP